MNCGKNGFILNHASFYSVETGLTDEKAFPKIGEARVENKLRGYHGLLWCFLEKVFSLNNSNE